MVASLSVRAAYMASRSGGIPTPNNEIVIALGGSSTLQRSTENFTGPVNARVFKTFDGVTRTALNGGGSLAANWGDQLQQATGKDVVYINNAVAGSSPADWLDNTKTLRSTLVASLIAAKNAGAPASALFLILGNGVVVDQASCEADARQIISLVRTESGMPALKVFLLSAQVSSSTDANVQRQIAITRAAIIAVSRDANNRHASDAYDLALISAETPPVHTDPSASPVYGARLTSSYLADLAGNPVPEGPRFTDAVAVDLTHTKAYFLPGNSGTAFTPTSGKISNIYLSVDDFANLLAVSSAFVTKQPVTVNGVTTPGEVTITHASTAGQAYKFNPAMVLYGEATNVLRDNSALTLPATPALASISIAAVPVPLAIDYDPMIAAQNVPGYSIKSKKVGGDGTAIVWALNSGALPAGTAVDSATGEITGNSTAIGNATFTIKATQSGVTVISPSKTIKTTATTHYATYNTAADGSTASAYTPEVGTALTGVSGGTSAISGRMRNTTQGTLLTTPAPNDQMVCTKWLIASVISTQGWGHVTRYASANDYDIARYRASQSAIVIERVTNAGTPSVIGSYPLTPAAGMYVEIQSEIVGASAAPPHVKVFVNHNLVVDKDDATTTPIASGAAGPSWNGGTGFADGNGAQLDTLIIAGA